MTKLLPIGVTVNKKNKCSMNDYGSISSSSLPLQKIRAIIVRLGCISYRETTDVYDSCC